VNAEAWRIHQTLRGRTVGACDLHSYVLERLTETWSADDVLDLVHRLDVISEFLETAKP
jgi:hypothetical protein